MVILPVPGYPGYHATSEGDILSTRRGRFLKLSPSPNSSGYPQVTVVTESGRRMPQRVHTLVALAFRGPRPRGMVIRHLDGDPQNSDPTNLRWGTPRQNVADSIAHGTVARGKAMPQAKLCEDAVRRIRVRRASGEVYRTIAADFGVTIQAVRFVCSRRIWAHVS